MSEITYIPIEQLYQHPDNPRKDLGDLTELADSIRENGILQNLTVVKGRRGTDEEIEQIVKLYDSLGDSKLEEDAKVEIREQIENCWVEDGYTIVIGHRRYAAAAIAGLTELPCTVVKMDYREQIQTMMVENMQRTDLTLYEQANGFQMMLDLGSPVDEISKRTGFSDTTVRKRLKWMELDHEKLKEKCAQQISITDLDRLSQINDISMRNECLDKIGTNDFNMAVQKAVKHQLIDENMPKVRDWLKSVKAKQIKDSERWSAKYDRIDGCSTIYIDKWDEAGNRPPDKACGKPLFYWLGEKGSYEYGQLHLYHEHQKAPPVKRPQEEIAKEKAIGAAWNSLESLAKTAYELRKKFIDDFNVTKKNESQVILGAVFAGCFNAVNYNSADRTMLYKVIGIEQSEAYIPKREEKLWDAFDKISGDDWAKLVYSLFGDDDKQTCSSGYRREFPKFTRSIKLELIYRWLSTLGYKMSTEEAQLLSGDHEVYKAGEEYGEV